MKSSFEDRKARIEATAKIIENQIPQFFEINKARVADWSLDGHIRKEFASLLKTRDRLKAEELSAYIKAKNVSLDDDVVLTDIRDVSGRIMVSTELDRLDYNDTQDLEDLDREYGFLKGLESDFGKPVAGGFLLEIEPGHHDIPFFHAAAPIVDLSTGKTIGVIINHVDIRELNKILASAPRDEYASYLVDQNKLIIGASFFDNPDKSLVYKAETKEIGECIDADKKIIDEHLNYEGKRVFGAVFCSKNTPWITVVEIDKGILDKDARKHAIELGALMLGIDVLVLMIAFIFGKRFTSRIKEKQTVLDQIKRGNFKARVNVPSNQSDEVAEVGRGINSMAESIEESFEKVSKLDQMKSAFIRVMSHQLRTPLTSIRWNLEVMLAGELGAMKKNQKDFLQIVYNADGEIINRLDDLLTAIDIEEGRVQFTKESFLLNDLVKSELIFWKKKYDAKGIDCRLLANKEKPVTVLADTRKLRFIIAELLRNSFVYTGSGGTVTVSIRMEKNMFVLR